MNKSIFEELIGTKQLKQRAEIEIKLKKRSTLVLANLSRWNWAKNFFFCLP